MQRLTSAAPIDDVTLATYDEMVSIIHRHLPPSLALLYATARRNVQGNLEWWTERQGLAKPFSELSDVEQIAVQCKRQRYQETLVSFIDKLAARGETSSAKTLQTLLTHSKGLLCYGVGGEPVLVNWAITQPTTEQIIPYSPWWRRLLPWLLLLLLLLALAYWWYRHVPLHESVMPEMTSQPASVIRPSEINTELTQDNPSISLTKRKDFGRIKVNLTWQRGENQRPIDLDIAAFIRFKNGDKGGVEALSKFQGYYDTPPYMMLQKDLRDGDDQNGEWLFINGSHWKSIDEVLIYSFIYGGAKHWQGTGATVTVYVPDHPPVITTVINEDKLNNVAAIARLKNVDGDIKVERLNSFFFDRESMDKHYNWGFEWTPGASKN